MRKILFRGKRTDNNLWIDGGYYEYRNFDGEQVCFIAHNGFENSIYPKTVGQYTGLTDKNGTKIFEGDILKGARGTLIKVYFDESYLQFRAKEFTHRVIDNSIDFYGDSSRLEVVGNIHDNKLEDFGNG